MAGQQEGKERAAEIFMIDHQSSSHAAVAVRKSTACVRAHSRAAGAPEFRGDRYAARNEL
jgi:hypothetical protein